MPNKILIVDDEPFNLDLLEQELMEYDYVLERAVDGVDALEKTASFSPDLILLDYMMPKMSGLEVVQQLRANEKHKGIPVILLTAKASQEDKIAGLDAGADDYVTKPFDSFELLARVRAMLRIKQLHDQLDEWNRTLAEKVQQQVAELERMNRLKRYLSPQIAQSILADEEDLFKTHRREITVEFFDMRGFTAFTDNAEPEEVMELLRSFHGALGKIALEHQGTIERFAGDAVMVFFNDPLPIEKPAEHAMQTALAVQEAFVPIGKHWHKRSGFELGLGVGIAQGYATLGAIGFEGRWDYAAIGNVTNLAARLCAEAKAGQILADRKTMAALEGAFQFDAVGPLTLKGFEKPVPAFALKR